MLFRKHHFVCPPQCVLRCPLEDSKKAFLGLCSRHPRHQMYFSSSNSLSDIIVASARTARFRLFTNLFSCCLERDNFKFNVTQEKVEKFLNSVPARIVVW